MSRDLVNLDPKSASSSAKTQAPVPARATSGVALATAGLGMTAAFIFHYWLLGAALFFLGGAWALLGKLRERLALVESGGQSAGSSGTDAADPAEHSRQELGRRLRRLQASDGCEELAERAGDQFSQALERRTAFLRLLQGKLSPGELTYARYRGAADQVFLAILDRLDDLADLLQSIAATRPGELAEKLRQASADAQAPLRDRQLLIDGQRAKCSVLLGENERALTELDRASAALTEMKTSQGLAQVDLPEALRQLEELAARAKRYST